MRQVIPVLAVDICEGGSIDPFILTSALEGLSGQLHASAVLPPVKTERYVG